MLKFIDAYRKFAYTDLYLALCAAIVTIAWAVQSAEFGFIALVVFACFALVMLDDALPLTAPVFYAMCMIYSDNVGDFLYLWPVFIPLGAAVIIFIARNRGRIKIGTMFFPQLAVSAALLLGGAGVCAVSDYVRALPSTLFLGVGVLAIYVLIYQFIRIDDRRDIGLYFSKMMLWFGMAVLVELIIAIAREGLAPSEWGHFYRDVGWGNENNIATILSLTAPLCFYLSTRYRNGWIYTLAAVAQYVGIILSFSRGSILMGAVTGPVCAVYALVKAVDRKRTGISYGVIIAAVLVLYFAFFGKVNDVFESLLGQGFGVSGRDKLYAEAWEVFLKYPFLGAGLGYNGPNYDINTMQFYWFHSTLFQVLANMGIVGIAAYAFYYFARFRTVCRRLGNPFNGFVLIAWLGFEGYSMMDTGTFVPFPTMTLILVMTAVLEYTNKAAPFKGEVDEYNRLFRRGGAAAKARYYDGFTSAYVRFAEA